LAPQNTRKFADDIEEEEADIPMMSDPAASFPTSSADGGIASDDAPKTEAAPSSGAKASGSSRRQQRGLKAPSNTRAFTDEDLAEPDEDIPTMDEPIVNTGMLDDTVAEPAGDMEDLASKLQSEVSKAADMGEFAAALEEAANAKRDEEPAQFRQSTLDASLAAHDMQRVSLYGAPARFSVVEREDCPVERHSVISDAEVQGHKAPANTIVLAEDDADKLREALSGAELQERLEGAAQDEPGRHPPANTTAVSPKEDFGEEDPAEVTQSALKAIESTGDRPNSSTTDQGLVEELHRRLSIEADAVLDPAKLQSRDLDLGAVDATAQPASTSAAGKSLVEPLADKTWDAGRNPAWPKMQWDLTKEYENDKQIEPIGKYSKNDLEMVAQGAKDKLEKGGQWLSTYSESGAQKRDFFQDLNRQRNKDKGMRATGPIWVHLATQAKNCANDFDLQELLITLKLFTSVRYDDYELYMRLLGEIPRFVAQATAVQLCSLICILARRRLQERNYVDMVASYLLQKLKVTDDHLPPRMLVKAANSFAGLECRSNQRFVEHFLRHMEHRIQELDAELCCKVSPLFVINYMNDSLRRAYLKRAAEVQAGFHGSLEECRNLACTEFCLRKEHHSLVSSLPAFVGRYLEKLKQHAAFDRWGTVHILTHHTPNGPKGTVGHDTNRALQQKASTVEGGKKVDVFSSEMHKDVSACLTHLGIEHESGVICGPYLLDCVAIDMVNPSKRIVYEVNAPHHFYEGTNKLIAEKRVRHRMLGRLGQKLHMINAEDWMKLTSAQKMTFMLQQQQSQQDKNEVTVKPPAIAREGGRPQIGTIPRAPPPPPRIQAPRSYPNRQAAATQ
jgi:hypothetical protein